MDSNSPPPPYNNAGTTDDHWAKRVEEKDRNISDEHGYLTGTEGMAGGTTSQMQTPAYPSIPSKQGYPDQSGYPQQAGYPNQQYGYPGQPTGYSNQYQYQQGQGYAGYPPGTQVIVQSPLVNPPDDYMCYSIFVTICCCWLIGIFAIIKSSECRSAAASGNRYLAEQRSREARKMGHIALGLGLVSLVLSIIILAVYFGLMFGMA